MRRRALVLAAGTIVTLAGMNVAFAAVPGTVSVGYNHTTELFHGAVSSSNGECQAGRTVKLYEEAADGPSLQGRVMSNENGRWSIEVMHASGRYFAVVSEQKVMHTTCGRARSRTVDVM